MDDFDPLQVRIMNILSKSDIVWPKYGSETIEDLAKEIAKEAKEVIREEKFISRGY